MNTPDTQNETAFQVEQVVYSRHSIRRFLSKPVSASTVRELLEVAAQAPSGTNVQPWKVYALTGEKKIELSNAITEKYLASGIEGMPFNYYPKEWVDPWLSRRRKTGIDLYALLGIAKGDKDKMLQQWIRNYQFFDAPVGLIFTVDKIIGQGMFLDYGMFIATLMIAARDRGLDTCTQLAFAEFQEVIHKTLDLPENEMIICGMSLGYADPDAPENKLRTEREPVENFADFRGFDD